MIVNVTDLRVILRPSTSSDFAFLEEMLFEAFFWDPKQARPPLAAFRSTAEFEKLLAGWGKTGDRAVVAESEAMRVGAAWYRLWTPEIHSHGFVDAATPEVAIAIHPGHRSRGIGRALLRELLEVARADGFATLSLSVDPSNGALRLYESLGFRKVGKVGTSWTMVVATGRSSRHSG